MDTIHCINNETWELYAANKLAERELDALQKHADTCELCSDIKEGIDAMPKPELLGEKLVTLNQHVDAYLEPPKRKRMPIWYWSAAAVLLISLGIGFIYTRTNTSDVALVTPEKNTEQPYIDTANTIENTPTINTPDEQTVTIKERPKKEQSREVKGTSDVEIATGDVGLDIKKEDSKTKNGELLYKKNHVKVITDDLSKSVEVTTVKPSLQRAEVTTSSTKDILKKVRKKKMALPSPQMNNMFNNNNFNNNLGLNSFDFKQPLDSLNYNTALLAFTNDSLDKCILSLSYIVQDANSKFYGDGLLLQAKALIKQNKKEEAKVVLKKAIALKGKRKREAKKLLRKLK